MGADSRRRSRRSSGISRPHIPGFARMKLALPIRSIFRPSWMSMIAVAASFAAWELPTFGVLLKGFTQKEDLDLTSSVTLFCWYALIFTCFYLGQKLGAAFARTKGPLLDPALALDANGIYYACTVISTVGTVSTLVQIFVNLSLQQALMFISLGQANALKDTLYEQYHVGIVSLRYLILYPA